MPPEEPKVENPTPTDEDPVSWSFLISGEPEKKLDLEDTPTEEELHKKAEREHRDNHSFAGLTRFQDEPEPEPEKEPEKEEKEKEPEKEPEKDPDTPEPEKEEPEPEPKPKKKVTFKEPPVLDPEPELEPKEEPIVDEEPEAPSASSLNDEDRAFVDTLPVEARESIDFWSGAEKVDPKYKGAAKKQLEYVRNYKAKVAELQAEDPDTPLEENPKYVAWVKANKPTAPRGEIERLKREIIVNEAEERASRKVKAIEDRLARQEFEQKELPRFQEKSISHAKNLMSSIGELDDAKDVVEFFNKTLEETKDPKVTVERMQEEYPDESEILIKHHRAGKLMADELLRVRMGFVEPDLKNNPMHRALAQRIQAQEEAMRKPEMKAHTLRDGKTFLPAYEYQELVRTSPEKAAKHWTFSTDEILHFLSAEVKGRVKNDLLAHKARVERILKRHAPKESPAGSQEKPDNPTPKPPKDGGPRHEGVETPSSGQRQVPSGEDVPVSRLIHFDF